MCLLTLKRFQAFVVITLFIIFCEVTCAPVRPKMTHECQKLEESDLKKLMGSAFDISSMAHVLPDVTATRNQNISTETESTDESSIRQRRDTEAQNSRHLSGRRNPGRRRRKHRRRLSWKCKCKQQWTDLGDQYYPRYVKEKICEQTKCWRGNYRCKARTYVIKVLKQNMDGCHDKELPTVLRTGWQFVKVHVRVGCECVSKKDWS